MEVIKFQKKGYFQCCFCFKQVKLEQQFPVPFLGEDYLCVACFEQCREEMQEMGFFDDAPITVEGGEN